MKLVRVLLMAGTMSGETHGVPDQNRLMSPWDSSPTELGRWYLGERY